ncbi:galanin receptor 2a-like [Lineus longissimus]|uniref:galanin receptor 2a-like n=1 Tax=Lineus longissimus TaxID=88925 RepID=UPI002B4F3163
MLNPHPESLAVLAGVGNKTTVEPWPSDPILPLTADRQKEFSLYTIPPIVTIGFIGNTLTFLVTMRKKNRHLPASLYMAMLAISDNISLISAHLFLNWMVYQLNFGAGTWFTSRVCGYLLFIIYFAGHADGWIIVAFTYDRYVATNDPLNAATRCSIKKAGILTSIIMAAMLLINSCTIWLGEVSILSADEPLMCLPSSNEVPHLADVYNWVEFVVGAVGPFAFLLYLNAKIISSVRSKEGPNRILGGSGKEEKESTILTRMLLLVSFMFIILNLPFRLYRNLFLVINFGTHNARFVFDVVLNILSLNYGINFFLYILGGGKRFRSDIRGLFVCRTT